MSQKMAVMMKLSAVSFFVIVRINLLAIQSSTPLGTKKNLLL
jgi:hypothetical protein